MARPKKDLAERLRVKSMMHFIAEAECLPFKPHVLEKHFEPENVKTSATNGQIYNSGKWRGYFNDGNFPGKKSYGRIWDRCPDAIRHLTSPFWDAVQQKRRSYDEWVAFYRRLDAQTEAAVLSFIANPQLLFNKKARVHRSVDALIRVGDDHSIAALIGLFRQYERTAMIQAVIEEALRKILFGFLARFCPKTFTSTLYHYLYTTIFTKCRTRQNSRRPWLSSVPDAVQNIQKEINNFELAERLSLVDSHTTHAEFFYWKARGNQLLIIQEMEELLFVPTQNHDLPRSQKGLRWLIKKLNRERPGGHQIPLTFLDK
ncbi:MAG: hypothetical protein GY738_12140 [Pseudoalteromonas sp.]|nr:hypothetical protein [Pseudoalteromonas sp.]